MPFYAARKKSAAGAALEETIHHAPQSSLEEIQAARQPQLTANRCRIAKINYALIHSNSQKERGTAYYLFPLQQQQRQGKQQRI